MDAKLVGALTPFMGGEEGATFVESTIVGEALHAVAVVASTKGSRHDWDRLLAV
jgi:hypothetical protein